MNNMYNLKSINSAIFCLRHFFAIIVLSVAVNVVNAQTTDSSPQIMKTISGIVRDAKSKQPISAVQLTLLDKKVSATTDANGWFRIKVTSGREILNVSAYDYGTRQYPLQGKDSVVIDLYSDMFTNFYKKSDAITGEVENLSLIHSSNGASGFERSTAISADDVLPTVMGGAVRAISRSGLAGIGSSIYIRGINTLNCNAQPLYVVDGVVWNNLYEMQSIQGGFYSNPLDNINVDDIESITVLKDGVSIYGSKAANGVVLVKTKRGKGMVTKINLSVSTGITECPSSLPVMNGDEFRTYASEIIQSAGVSPKLVSGLGFLVTNPAEYIYNTYHNNTNWSKEVYQTGMNQNYSISANGGDDKALYYFSVGYTGNKGVVKTTDMERINTMFNADIKMLKALSIGMTVGFTHIGRTLLDDGVNNYTSPTWLSLIKSPFLSPYAFTDVGVKSLDYAETDCFGIGNPSGIIEYSLNKTKQYRFNIGVTPRFQLSRNLSFSSHLDYSLNKFNERYFSPMYFVPVIYIIDKGYSQNMLTSQVMRNNVLFDDSQLNWSNKFGADHRLNLILGSRYLNNYFESDYEEGHNTGSNDVTTLNGGLAFLKVDGINRPVISLSNYANIDYSFANRYFLNAAVSMDGSSKFGKETKGGVSMFGNSWGVFPSVNAGWLVSSEKFMKKAGFINLMKLRAGYSVTGNDDIQDDQSMAYFTSVRFMGRANGIVLSNIENSEVQWETTRRASAGIDLNLFNERLSITLDGYTGKTDDLLTLRSLPDVTGSEYYWSNGGELSNKGFEFSANLKLLNLKNLKWEIGASVGHYSNKVLSLPDGDYNTKVYNGEVRTAVGQPLGVFYGYKTAGVFATAKDASDANLSMVNDLGVVKHFSAGDVHFVDNGDHVINEYDKQVIGNPNPDIYGAFTSKIGVKMLTLSALFTYSCGNDIYNYQRSQLEAGSTFFNQSTAMLNRWTADGQHTLQPKATYGDPMGNARFSDRWIEDGSYIRLKTLSLSYELPLKSSFIEGLNVWVSANNLFTATRYLGLDPEVSVKNSVLYQGVDAGLLPLTKSYYIGFRFNL